MNGLNVITGKPTGTMESKQLRRDWDRLHRLINI